ncbi:MAG: hypothetical protein ACE5GQ_10410 [Nitrospinales bacterium]
MNFQDSNIETFKPPFEAATRPAAAVSMAKTIQTDARSCYTSS